MRLGEWRRPAAILAVGEYDEPSKKAAADFGAEQVQLLEDRGVGEGEQVLSWVSAVSENSVQAGTAMMSPRSKRDAGVPGGPQPPPSNTCQTEDAEVRDRRVAAPAASRWNSVLMQSEQDRT